MKNIRFIPELEAVYYLTTLSQTIDWGVKAIGAPDVWKHTKGRGVRVVVLDTGVCITHPDLNITSVYSGCGDDGNDKHGHGTHCCGIIAAQDNGIGVVGVSPDVELHVGKILDNNGFGSYELMRDGLQWACSIEPDIISMSLGANQKPPSYVFEAIEEALSRGIAIFAAAGNDGRGLNITQDSVDYPARIPGVFAVGANNKDGSHAEFSAPGPDIDFCAPGVDIFSTYKDNGYAALRGTSMACPMVVGAAALILARHKSGQHKTPINNQNDLYDHLRRIANDAGEVGKDNYFGYGIIDLNKEQFELLSKEGE
jgi:subtilisin family serine protease